MQHILGAGLLAPSADNRHTLRLQVGDDAVRLLSTDAASWPAQPHRQMLALLSYGAVIENMALRSAELGLTMTAELWPDAACQDRVADLRWVAAPVQTDPLAQAIATRHTNRRFYRRTAVPAQTLRDLSAAAATVPGAQVRWLDDNTERRTALRALRIAETERFRRRALHQELFAAVRFDIGWQRTTDEGLPPGALQVEWPMRGMFSLLRHWPVMRVVNAFGAHHLLGLRAAYLPCALAPQLGLMLAGAASDASAAVHAGRSFQRLWLAATAAGLALQPMAAAAALARQSAGAGWVGAGPQAELKRLLPRLCGGSGLQPYLLFRLGYAEAPTVVSARPTLEGYVA